LPSVHKSEVLMTCVLTFLIMSVVGAVCLRVASMGGPEWMEGRELEVFLKLAGLTVAAAIAEISWRATRVTIAEDRS